MTHASLFSGIGGFDLAAEWAGWTNLFNCEIDDFCRKILNYHFPDATQYKDIRTVDFAVWRGRVDVLSGGFPCQPFSLAGKRQGTADDRYLWPEMLRAIRSIRPRWVVGENVYGFVNWSRGLVFEQVCSDLEDEGYTVQAYILPACAVDAPHRRDRVWIIAHADRDGGSAHTGARESVRDCSFAYEEQYESIHVHRITADGSDAGVEDMQGREVLSDELENAPHANRNRCGKWSREQEFIAKCERASDAGNDEQARVAADSSRVLLQRRKKRSGKIQSRGDHLGAICWADFPTQSPICRRDDGLFSELDGITFPRWRRESLKAYGNAVVPQLVYEIFETINDYERSTTRPMGRR